MNGASCSHAKYNTGETANDIVKNESGRAKRTPQGKIWHEKVLGSVANPTRERIVLFCKNARIVSGLSDERLIQ